LTFRRIFIVGTGRCGTHSIAAALGTVDGILSTHEKFPLARHISNKLWDGEIDEEEALRLIRGGLSEFDRHHVWIDANCLLWNFISLLDDALDGMAAYAYVKRDRQDTIDSMFRTRFYGKGKFPWEKRAKRGFISYESPSYSDEDMLRNCEYAYQIRTEAIENSLHSIPENRKIQVEFGQNGYFAICGFVERMTGIHVGFPPLPRISSTEK